MGAFAPPPGGYGEPARQKMAGFQQQTDAWTREGPLRALFELGLQRVHPGSRCLRKAEPGAPTCLLIPGGGSGPGDCGLWSTLDFALAHPNAGRVAGYAGRCVPRGVRFHDVC